MQDDVRTLLLMLLEVAVKDWRGCAAAAARRQQRSRSVVGEALELVAANVGERQRAEAGRAKTARVLGKMAQFLTPAVP